MAYHEYEAHSLSEFFECINHISKINSQDEFKPKVLWFRGHQMSDWLLKPTLYRYHPVDETSASWKPIGGLASTIAVQEELRKQYFIAKNYHYLQKDMNSNLEWFEIMQHHGVTTRIMDWSESAIHSLLFTLECFLDKGKFKNEDRLTCSPCVWVLEPIAWNELVLKKILSNKRIINQCVDSLNTSAKVKDLIRKRMNGLTDRFEEYMGMKDTEHLKFLFNLGNILQDFDKMNSAEIIHQLKDGEYYYCLFYLLKYVYMNHGVYDCTEVLPLSIIESYHSERIKAQKGTFSIFPYYQESDFQKKWKLFGVNLDAMENMDLGNHLLHKILICNPDKIAYELISMGVDDTWLYPEMPVSSNTIERREVLRIN